MTLAFGLSVTGGVALGSVAAIGVIGHAMFVNAPVDDASGSAPRTATPADASGGTQAPNAD